MDTWKKKNTHVQTNSTQTWKQHRDGTATYSYSHCKHNTEWLASFGRSLWRGAAGEVESGEGAPRRDGIILIFFAAESLPPLFTELVTQNWYIYVLLLLEE